MPGVCKVFSCSLQAYCVLSLQNDACMWFLREFNFSRKTSCSVLVYCFYWYGGHTNARAGCNRNGCCVKAHNRCFYGFANCEEEGDYFWIIHVHGLSTSYLKRHGSVNELTLLQASEDCLKKKPFIRIDANAEYKESKALCHNIYDANLSCFADHQFETPQITALRYKESMLEVNHACCSKIAHSFCQGAPTSDSLETFRAKERHPFHCALYDEYELYFHSILS